MNLVNRLVSAFLILTHTMWKTQANECCPMKMVGSTSYTLLAQHFHGKLPDQCTNSCVYTITNTSAPKFCFKKGKKLKIHSFLLRRDMYHGFMSQRLVLNVHWIIR